VKYILVAGDIVDGIGIYPNQEKELVVKDVYKQYEMFDDLFQSFPITLKLLSDQETMMLSEGEIRCLQ